ncbi:MAG TPA: FtsX-like permease family protein [Fibrobacteria bacterium]|nr:FtsX-like permease family protein [Fibrobacteria bacterium]
MLLIFKLAFRNIRRHRGQSLVIGAILFLGSLLMAVGNGVVSGMERGLRRTVAHGFTGDLVVLPDEQLSDNVFMEMMGRAVEPLYGYPALKAALDSDPLVAAHLPIGKGTVMVLNEDDGPSVFLYLIGVDFSRYAEVFPDNLRMLEGGFPRPGATGLLLPTGARKDIQRQANLWFRTRQAGPDTAGMDEDARRHAADLSRKSDMVLMGFNDGNTATDVRLPVDGIFRYRALNSIFGSFALADIESFRRCTGYFTDAERSHAALSGRDSVLMALDEKGMDALFGGDPGRAALSGSPESVPAETAPAAAPAGGPEAGAYHMVLVILRAGAAPDRAAKALNASFTDRKLRVRAVTWQKALGPIGSMATLIKAALTLFVTFLFVVAIIIIVNTLTMAALERTPELGMMRAIGARKGFIARMFLAETGLLSALFGGLGIGAGAATTLALAALELTSGNDMLQLAFGGDTFRPVLLPGDFLLAAAQLALVAVFAVAYPVMLARKVSALDAVYRE